MLGALERIADVENLFTHLRFCKRDIILSYCATDLAKDLDRAALGFVNHLSFYDLALLFDRYGFRIECTSADRRDAGADAADANRVARAGGVVQRCGDHR